MGAFTGLEPSGLKIVLKIVGSIVDIILVFIQRTRGNKLNSILKASQGHKELSYPVG